jgi:hypothetical protein
VRQAEPEWLAAFERDGYVILNGMFQSDEILALRSHADALIASAARGPGGAYVQTAFNADGAPRLTKVSGLAESDDRFKALATRTPLVDAVEAILGSGARRFRDVLVVKPGRTGGSLSYHQDSAYWDVEPKALVSAWIALGDVPREGSCLSVVAGTHRQAIDHGLYLHGTHQVPRLITATLRRLVSLAGTGDNPRATGGSLLVWKLKRWLLAGTTKYFPALFDLQDFRIPPSALKGRTEVFLPVQAGDVILFHSLLWHASGPNTTTTDRLAEIISFMGPTARFVGRGHGEFPLARRA